MNAKCLRCGQDGYFAQECKLPVLPDDRVLAVPMTDAQAYALIPWAECNSFIEVFEVIRAVERFHGIVGKEGA